METYTLYIGGRRIKKVKEINTDNVKIEDIRTEQETERCESINIGGTLELVKIERMAMLSLAYGRKITNNWLKMHGRVMSRRSGKKKERKKNEQINERAEQGVPHVRALRAN